MLCFVSSSFAQHANPPDPPVPSQQVATVDGAPRIIQLGPGDSVSMQVYGQPDMTTTFDVSDNGTIPVPLAGPVQVGGLSPSEAGQRIAKALRDGKFLVDPQVTVNVTLSRSQRISVSGQVGHPGVYSIESNTTIFDVMALAGGTLDTASDEVFLLRADAAGNTQRYPINLRGLDDPKKSIPNQALRGGDSIFVPRAEQFYIYGEVTAPNKYRVEPKMTVIEAISRAGGVTPRGSERRVEIKRMSNGNYITFKAKLSDLVQPDDVIRVKESIF
jgi:polysaccharide export outer membrane protein